MRPQARLLVLLIFVFTISMLHSLKVIFILFLCSFLTILLKERASKLKTSFHKALPVIVITFLIGIPSVLSFFSPGREIFSLTSSISITDTGIMTFLRFFLRTFTIILIVSYYLSAHGEVEFIRALWGLKLPSEVLLIFSMAIRHILIFLKDYNDFAIAKRIRAVKYSGTWNSIKWVALKSGVLLDKALRSAIESGYGLTLKLAGEKIVMHKLEGMRRRDIISILLMLFLSVLAMMADKKCL